MMLGCRVGWGCWLLAGVVCLLFFSMLWSTFRDRKNIKGRYGEGHHPEPDYDVDHANASPVAHHVKGAGVITYWEGLAEV